MPEGIHNRRADNWRPLLSIADLAGGEWPERARQAAVALTSKADDTASIRVQLIEDIYVVFNDPGADRISSKALVGRLHDMEDRPWPEYRKGWDLKNSHQWGEPYKIYGTREDIFFKPQ